MKLSARLAEQDVHAKSSAAECGASVVGIANATAFYLWADDCSQLPIAVLSFESGILYHAVQGQEYDDDDGYGDDYDDADDGDAVF